MSVLPTDLRILPAAQRIQLAEALWDSVAAEQNSMELTDAQKMELDRRLAARHGRSAASPWADVKRRILGQ
jgi:putative addiction module component (TIGR02574 family)